MNPNEKQELQRLMSMSEEEYDYWLDHAGDEEVEVAVELFEAAKREIKMQLEIVDTPLEESEDVALAQAVLARFTLKGL